MTDLREWKKSEAEQTSVFLRTRRAVASLAEKQNTILKKVASHLFSAAYINARVAPELFLSPESFLTSLRCARLGRKAANYMSEDVLKSERLKGFPDERLMIIVISPSSSGPTRKPALSEVEGETMAFLGRRWHGRNSISMEVVYSTKERVTDPAYISRKEQELTDKFDA